MAERVADRLRSKNLITVGGAGARMFGCCLSGALDPEAAVGEPPETDGVPRPRGSARRAIVRSNPRFAPARLRNVLSAVLLPVPQRYTDERMRRPG